MTSGEPSGQPNRQAFLAVDSLHEQLQQQQIAQQSKHDQQSKLESGTTIATAIEPFSNFFPAEDYHQQFYKKQPDEYYRYKLLSGRGH